MKNYYIVLLLLTAACNPGTPTETQNTNYSVAIQDTVVGKPRFAVSLSMKSEQDSGVAKQYNNKRFREVQVEEISEGTFRITGKAQVFEAAFSWVVEDGHRELKKGHQMTNAGAPEWGSFSFVIEAGKEKANSRLHLILFEASAKDGTRQYELPVPLY